MVYDKNEITGTEAILVLYLLQYERTVPQIARSFKKSSLRKTLKQPHKLYDILSSMERRRIVVSKKIAPPRRKRGRPAKDVAKKLERVKKAYIVNAEWLAKLVAKREFGEWQNPKGFISHQYALEPCIGTIKLLQEVPVYGGSECVKKIERMGKYDFITVLLFFRSLVERWQKNIEHRNYLIKYYHKFKKYPPNPKKIVKKFRKDEPRLKEAVQKVNKFLESKKWKEGLNLKYIIEHLDKSIISQAKFERGIH